MHDIQVACQKIIESGMSYPPSLPVLHNMLKYSSINFDDAFERFMRARPASRAERYVFQHYGYDLRSMEWQKCRREFERILKLITDRDRAGGLKQRRPLKRLIQHSKSLSDDMRELCYEHQLDHPSRFPVGSVFNRVALKWGSCSRSA